MRRPTVQESRGKSARSRSNCKLKFQIAIFGILDMRISTAVVPSIDAWNIPQLFHDRLWRGEKIRNGLHPKLEFAFLPQQPTDGLRPRRPSCAPCIYVNCDSRLAAIVSTKKTASLCQYRRALVYVAPYWRGLLLVMVSDFFPRWDSPTVFSRLLIDDALLRHRCARSRQIAILMVLVMSPVYPQHLPVSLR